MKKVFFYISIIVFFFIIIYMGLQPRITFIDSAVHLALYQEVDPYQYIDKLSHIEEQDIEIHSYVDNSQLGKYKIEYQYQMCIRDRDMTKRDYNYSKQDDMYLRALQIDEYQPDLFLSIHLNSSSSSAWGSQVFYYHKSEEGKRLAEIIHNQMKTLTGTRKNVSSCSFYILRATQSLGVLIECGFISNANERGQLKSQAYHKKLAVVISDGVEEYFQSLSAPL